MIAVTYVVYPVLIAMVARAKKTAELAEEAGDDELPRVAIVVAAYNEEAVIAEKIANTWEIDYPRNRLRPMGRATGQARSCARMTIAG
jgi:cellulose synthase/poly-beta-1,6-N-acetylglucosamine synthase-like glycosyltransferase